MNLWRPFLQEFADGQIRTCRRMPVSEAWMVALPELFFFLKIFYLSSEESPGQSGVPTMCRVETDVYPVQWLINDCCTLLSRVQSST